MEITLYTGSSCVWCSRAKALLKNQGFPFKELRAADHMDFLKPLGVRTVPQVFIDGRHIGGYTNLAEWIRENGE